MSNGSPLGLDPMANVQISEYSAPVLPKFIDNAINNSETPISTAQDVTTQASSESCWADQTAQHIKLDKAGQMAIRNKAFNFSRPNTDNTLPDFEAAEND